MATETDDEYFVVNTDCGFNNTMAMMALNYIQCERYSNKKLLGIVCGAGKARVDEAVENVLLTLMRTKESNVKVFKGSHCSLFKKYKYYDGDGVRYKTHYTDSMNSKHSKVEKENGVQALINFVRQYPKKVTILCLGPLTNLALAHLIDDKFFEYTKQVYILGGNINGVGNVTPTAEFNFYFDPEAVEITLENAKCPIYIIPWEVCLDCRLDQESYSKLIQMRTKNAAFYKPIMEWTVKEESDNSNGFSYQDFLLIAAYVNPKVVLETKKWVAVIESNGEVTRGQLVVHKEKEIDSAVATFVTKVDDKMVYEMFESMFL